MRSLVIFMLVLHSQALFFETAAAVATASAVANWFWRNRQPNPPLYTAPTLTQYADSRLVPYEIGYFSFLNNPAFIFHSGDVAHQIRVWDLAVVTAVMVDVTEDPLAWEIHQLARDYIHNLSWEERLVADEQFRNFIVSLPPQFITQYLSTSWVEASYFNHQGRGTLTDYFAWKDISNIYAAGWMLFVGLLSFLFRFCANVEFDVEQLKVEVASLKITMRLIIDEIKNQKHINRYFHTRIAKLRFRGF